MQAKKRERLRIPLNQGFHVEPSDLDLAQLLAADAEDLPQVVDQADGLSPVDLHRGGHFGPSGRSSTMTLTRPSGRREPTKSSCGSPVLASFVRLRFRCCIVSPGGQNSSRMALPLRLVA